MKWAGGKRWQVPLLQPLWQAHARRRLVEPFCGGLAVALGLRPRRALLNDANVPLIHFYRWLQQGPRRPSGGRGTGKASDFGLQASDQARAAPTLKPEAWSLKPQGAPHSDPQASHLKPQASHGRQAPRLDMANDADLYYRHRARFNELLTAGRAESAEAALLFYYLNRTGYNGLCRFNRRGLFNVPFGRYRSITYRDDFTPYRRAFADWVFTAGDVEAVALHPDDFVYADPPYDVEFTHYAQGGFSWDDQERTAAFLARHPGPVVLVNQATPRIKSLYRRLGYRLRFVDAPRRINCTGDRSPAREVLATRNM